MSIEHIDDEVAPKPQPRKAREPAPSPDESFDAAQPVQVDRQSVDQGGVQVRSQGAGPHPSSQEHQQDRSRNRPAAPQGLNGSRTLPASEEAESHVLAVILLDEVQMDRAQDHGLTERSFYHPANALIWSHLVRMKQRGVVLELSVLVQELVGAKELEAVGGLPYLMQVTGSIPTTAHGQYMIEKVRELETKRELIKLTTGVVEQAYNGADLLDLLEQTQRALTGLEPVQSTTKARSLDQFNLVRDGDKSILLGNRYLVRGDGMVLSGTSGMGKSALSIQCAILAALGRSIFGIAVPAALRSLIVQSEDSDGDVAEMVVSVMHALNLTEQERALVNARVRIVTERVARGEKFLRSLKKWTKDFTPDLVWINPLQAFFDGDLTQSKDLGKFLREGLNGLNKDSAFAYIIVHHTTKPATGKDRADRLWHEVMYDMAGGADLINWARAIMSLRASAEEGEFNLVLAKRGRRAGVMVEVEQGIGVRYEATTTIPLKHATGRIEADGIKGGLPLIFWESRLPDQKIDRVTSGGRPEKYPFSDFISVFPSAQSKGLPLGELHRALISNAPIDRKILHNVLKRWDEEGVVETIRGDGPMRYRQRLTQRQ